MRDLHKKTRQSLGTHQHLRDAGKKESTKGDQGRFQRKERTGERGVRTAKGERTGGEGCVSKIPLRQELELRFP